MAASTTTASPASVQASRIAPGLAYRRHHQYSRDVVFGDLVGDGQPDTVVAAEAVADADHNVDAHRRSMVSVRKCAEHEMQGSWLRMALSHIEVNAASSNDRLVATSSAISCSMAA